MLASTPLPKPAGSIHMQVGRPEWVPDPRLFPGSGCPNPGPDSSEDSAGAQQSPVSARGGGRAGGRVPSQAAEAILVPYENLNK